MRRFLCIIAIVLMGMTSIFAQTPNYQGVIYVTPTGAGTHSGDSWANATSSIADAQIFAQANNAVVWVAAGIYYGDTTVTAENAFTMMDGVNVYGGFAGNEPANYDLSQRNFETNETILDGDSARRVLYQPSGFSDTTIWDGFTIRNGYAYYDDWGGACGGGIVAGQNSIISQCKITNNTAYCAGGISALRSTIRNCLVFNNNMANFEFGGPGGVMAYNTTIENCQIFNNDGGGVDADNSTFIINCEIYDNTVGVDANNSTFIINCEIHDNGYGVYAQNSAIENCQIYNNFEAVYASNNSTITNCQIHDNTPGSGENAVNLSSSSISNCEIFNNTGSGVSSSNSIVSECQIYNNLGCGIDARYSSVVSECEIYNNTGYIVSAVNVENATIIGCTIYKNTSTNHYGGAVFGWNFSISNCVIYNNQGTTVYNAGIYALGSSVISNCTIVHNEGSGVYGGSTTTMTNSIVWGNSFEGSSSNINGSEILNCTYSAIEGGYPGLGNMSLIPNTIYQPLFFNPSLNTGAGDTTANVDWHLQNGSVCVNRGNNASLIDSLDLDGTTRIKRDTIDMGCYESDYYSISIPYTYHGIVYVSPTGAGTRSGDSWANAMASIDDAQAMAINANADVWVSAGIYYGDTLNENAFTMKGINVYGGFTGTESANFDLSQRNFETNATILDGQHRQRVLSQPYSFNEEKIWDGFTIQNGYSSTGAGAYLRHLGRLNKCIIRNNMASMYYGGVRAENSTISYCRIHNNTSNYWGGLYAYNNTSVFECEIYNNTTNSGGGVCGIHNSIVKSSTIVHNEGYGIMFIDNGQLINSIVWGNVFDGNSCNISISGDNIVCSFSAIEGGYEGNNNITLDRSNQPQFVNPSLTAGASDTTVNVDWHLQNGSVCVNRGNNAAVLDSMDLDGTARIKRDTVDMGCYESDFYSVPINCTSFGDTIAVVCGSFSWHNYENLTESGNYVDTMVNMAGCDSIVTLHLTVHPSASSEFFVSSPDSCYIWNGETYCTSGDYTQTLQTIHGCDSVVTLHLTIETGINDHKMNAHMNIYPNPTSDVINVQLTMNNEQTGNVAIQVFDVYGKMLDASNVVNTHGTSLQTRIDLSRYANGVYFIKVVSEGNVLAVRKVVKNR